MTKKIDTKTVEQEPRIDLTAENPLATINRSAMSRALRVDLAHISRILSGQRNPSLRVAVKMAEYLGMSLDDFNKILPKAQ